MIYDNIIKRGNRIKDYPKVKVNCVNGCYIELVDWPEDTYNIQFINRKTDEVLFSVNIGNNSWAKCNFEYYVDWRVIISQQGEIVRNIYFNLENERVYISLQSKSLGDTLAWMPYAEEFRKKHRCKLILSTFLNDLFKDQYPEIEFVEPGATVTDIIAQYNIGWFYNGDLINRFKHPTDPKPQPMQKTAADILGLDFKEIKPLIKIPEVQKYDTVTLGIHSTAQSKYWNNPEGWQEVVDYINSINHTPILVSREESGFMGNFHPQGISKLPPSNLEELIKTISSSKLFIGVGSGLSWLAWACNVPVILISGFSEPYTEMSECVRIDAPEGACRGCFNRYKLDAQDWNWCPDHKGTHRQFECSKLIDSQLVINQIKQILYAD